MQWILIALVSLLSVSATASQLSEKWKSALLSQSDCQNFVRFDANNLYLGFGSYKRGFEEPREPIPGFLRVAPLQNGQTPFDLATNDSTIDSLSDGNSLYILTYSGIEEWNLSQKTRVAIYPTSLRPAVRYKQHALAFARYQNKLVIAHGRFGVSFFDMETKKITAQIDLVPGQAPLESMATGLIVKDNKAYIVLDNFHVVTQGKQPFRGIVTVDLDRELVSGRSEGMDPGATSLAGFGSDFIVSFNGLPLWKYSLSAVQTPQLAAPDSRVWRFPEIDHPIGKAVIDDLFYYSCALKAPAQVGEPYTRVPVVLERANWNL